MDWVRRNWKHVIGYVAVAGASYYGGPNGVAALKELAKTFGW